MEQSTVVRTGRWELEVRWREWITEAWVRVQFGRGLGLEARARLERDQNVKRPCLCARERC